MSNKNSLLIFLKHILCLKSIKISRYFFLAFLGSNNSWVVKVEIKLKLKN